MLVSVGVLDILLVLLLFHFFFFKQKTAYEMRISDWSSDVCSSDLRTAGSRPGSRRALKLWRRWRATTAILVATRPGSPTAASSRKSITRGASRCRWAIILGWSRSMPPAWNWRRSRRRTPTRSSPRDSPDRRVCGAGAAGGRAGAEGARRSGRAGIRRRLLQLLGSAHRDRNHRDRTRVV